MPGRQNVGKSQLTTSSGRCRAPSEPFPAQTQSPMLSLGRAMSTVKGRFHPSQELWHRIPLWLTEQSPWSGGFISFEVRVWGFKRVGVVGGHLAWAPACL